jgi:hypothetical protein
LCLAFLDNSLQQFATTSRLSMAARDSAAPNDSSSQTSTVVPVAKPVDAGSTEQERSDTETEEEGDAALDALDSREAKRQRADEEREIEVDWKDHYALTCRTHALETCADCGLDFSELNSELRASHVPFTRAGAK